MKANFCATVTDSLLLCLWPAVDGELCKTVARKYSTNRNILGGTF